MQLTAKPVNTRALSFLSSVAGESLTKHLGKILPALMDSLSDHMGTPDEQQVNKALCSAPWSTYPVRTVKMFGAFPSMTPPRLYIA